MLGKADATPMIAVTDLDRARKFYEDKLGLKTKDEWGGEGVTLKSGDTLINVYKSEFAGTNKATALTFDVDDIEKEVGELKEKGIFFETLRPARASSRRATSMSARGLQDRLVQGPGRQHPEPDRRRPIAPKKGRRANRRPSFCSARAASGS